ncbi:hypothetical protein JB92DRAFT_1308775 [Gautieria morchelliformis]|nr:hypothetical protein JB92DRAFT_1308775 [Gautieria morchelliformis]
MLPVNETYGPWPMSGTSSVHPSDSLLSLRPDFCCCCCRLVVLCVWMSLPIRCSVSPDLIRRAISPAFRATCSMSLAFRQLRF